MGALRDKSFLLAVLVVNTCKKLQSDKEYILSKQFLRSGTAIGALIRESEFAQSKPDFINKLHISLKEANESIYWIDLLKETNYINLEQHESLFKATQEMIKLIVASIKTAKNNK
jgi:four helix bundle protein